MYKVNLDNTFSASGASQCSRTYVTHASECCGKKSHCKVDLQTGSLLRHEGTGKFEGLHRKLPRTEEEENSLKKRNMHPEVNGTKPDPEEHWLAAAN